MRRRIPQHPSTSNPDTFFWLHRLEQLHTINIFLADFKLPILMDNSTQSVHKCFLQEPAEFCNIGSRWNFHWVLPLQVAQRQRPEMRRAHRRRHGQLRLPRELRVRWKEATIYSAVSIYTEPILQLMYWPWTLGLLRAILNYTPGPQGITSPLGVNLSPRGELCPIGVKFTPSFTPWGEHSLLFRRMEGRAENFTPRG
jgi:hypothetical protein